MASRASTESPFLFLLPFAFLAVLPVVFALWLADHALAIRRDSAVQGRVEASRQEVCRVLAAAEPTPFVQRRLARLKDQIFRARPDPEKLRLLLPPLGERWGFKFDTWLFDGAGRLVFSDEQKPEYREMMSSLWDALVNRRPVAGEYLQYLEDLKGIFGDQFAPVLLKRKRARATNLQPVTREEVINGRRVQGSEQKGQPGLFTWDVDPFSRFGGVMFVVWELPTQMEFLRALLPRTGLASSSLFFINPVKKATSFEGKPVSEDMQKILLADFTLRERGWNVIGERLWIMQTIGDVVLYVDLPFETRSFDLQLRNARLTALLFLIVGFLFFRVHIGRARRGEVLIRVTLLRLFLFAFFVPLVSAALYAVIYLETSIPRMEKVIRDKAEEILQRFSNTKAVVRDAQRQSEGTLRSVLRTFAASKDPEEFFQHLETGRERRLFAEFRLFDGRGGPLSTTPDGRPPDMGNAETERFWRNLAMLCLQEQAIRATLPVVASAATSSDVASFPTFQVAVEKDLRGIARRNGMVSLLAIQGADQLFWDTFQVPWSKAAIAFFRNRLEFTLEHFLQRVFSRRESFGAHAFRFMFCLNDLMVRYPLEVPFPRHFSQLHHMTLIMSKITRRPMFRRTAWNGQACYVLAASSVVFDNSVLFILYPQAPVLEFLDRERARLILLFILAIPLLFGLSVFLSRVCETPIANLDVLRTMQDRLKGFELAGISASAAGGVDAAFDSIIENLGEINTARSIQEQLFPLEALSLDSYSAFGISKPARDLGGDYFDYHVVDKDHILVVIGDVTGHGIPAALVVSMAKAVVTDFARSGGRNPSELLDRLDLTLHESVKKKRYMTLALLWIDTVTHQAQYFNCGHPYPILAHANGEIGFLAGRGYFLGREIKVPRVAISFTLNPGDRFVFYTDGLVESLNPNETQNAFDQFLEFVRDNGKGGAVREVCQSLFQRHPHILSGKPLPDDFTLVVVERKT